jgi:hypothetical protein
MKPSILEFFKITNDIQQLRKSVEYCIREIGRKPLQPNAKHQNQCIPYLLKAQYLFFCIFPRPILIKTIKKKPRKYRGFLSFILLPSLLPIYQGECFFYRFNYIINFF